MQRHKFYPWLTSQNDNRKNAAIAIAVQIARMLGTGTANVECGCPADRLNGKKAFSSDDVGYDDDISAHWQESKNVWKSLLAKVKWYFRCVMECPINNWDFSMLIGRRNCWRRCHALSSAAVHVIAIDICK